MAYRHRASEQKDGGSARIARPPGAARVGEDVAHEQHGAARVSPGKVGGGAARDEGDGAQRGGTRDECTAKAGRCAHTARQQVPEARVCDEHA